MNYEYDVLTRIKNTKFRNWIEEYIELLEEEGWSKIAIESMDYEILEFYLKNNLTPLEAFKSEKLYRS